MLTPKFGKSFPIPVSLLQAIGFFFTAREIAHLKELDNQTRYAFSDRKFWVSMIEMYKPSLMVLRDELPSSPPLSEEQVFVNYYRKTLEKFGPEKTGLTEEQLWRFLRGNLGLLEHLKEGAIRLYERRLEVAALAHGKSKLIDSSDIYLSVLLDAYYNSNEENSVKIFEVLKERIDEFSHDKDIFLVINAFIILLSIFKNDEQIMAYLQEKGYLKEFLEGRGADNLISIYLGSVVYFQTFERIVLNVPECMKLKIIISLRNYAETYPKVKNNLLCVYEKALLDNQKEILSTLTHEYSVLVGERIQENMRKLAEASDRLLTFQQEKFSWMMSRLPASSSASTVASSSSSSTSSSSCSSSNQEDTVMLTEEPCSKNKGKKRKQMKA